jgi:hypothetical protein
VWCDAPTLPETVRTTIVSPTVSRTAVHVSLSDSLSGVLEEHAPTRVTKQRVTTRRTVLLLFKVSRRRGLGRRLTGEPVHPDELHIEFVQALANDVVRPNLERLNRMW